MTRSPGNSPGKDMLLSTMTLNTMSNRVSNPRRLQPHIVFGWCTSFLLSMVLSLGIWYYEMFDMILYRLPSHLIPSMDVGSYRRLNNKQRCAHKDFMMRIKIKMHISAPTIIPLGRDQGTCWFGSYRRWFSLDLLLCWHWRQDTHQYAIWPWATRH